MQKQISPLDLLTKSSIYSFLVESPNESHLIIPGVFFDMPGKFFKYYDIVDVTLKIMRPNEEGIAVVDMEEFQKELTPRALDLNKFFSEMEERLKNRDIFSLKVEQTNSEKLPQPTIPTIGELKADVEDKEKKENDKEEDNEKNTKENVKKETTTEEKPKTYTKKQYNSKKYNNTYKSSGYRKNYYNKGYQNNTSANGNTTANGKDYNSGYKRTYTKSYNKSYKKSENK